MDGLIIINNIAKIKKNESLEKEKFSSDDGYMHMFNMGAVLSFFIGAYAAYLSYTCNTKEEMECATKVIYAILAYIFGLFYLLYYFLFRNEYCSTL